MGAPRGTRTTEQPRQCIGDSRCSGNPEDQLSEILRAVPSLTHSKCGIAGLACLLFGEPSLAGLLVAIVGTNSSREDGGSLTWRTCAGRGCRPRKGRV